MRIPRFLIEDTDLASFEAELGESVKKDKQWVTLLPSEWALFSNKVFRSKHIVAEALEKIHLLEVVGRIVELWDRAETVSDQASVLTAILQLRGLREDVPRKLLQLLPPKLKKCKPDV